MDTIGAVGRVAAIHFITPSHVLAGLERLHALVVKEQELAEARLRKSGRDDAMAIVVALGAFETPEPTKEF